MQLLTRQKTILSFLTATVLMGFIALRAYSLPEEQAVEGEWVVHTHEVLHQIELLSGHLADAQNGERGYLLTGKEEYLRPYQEAIHRIDRDIDAFQKLTLDNPAQQAQVPLLRQRLNDQLSVMKNSIDQNSESIREAQRKVPSVIDGTQQTDVIEQQLSSMSAEEARLLRERMARWHSSIARTSVIFVFCVLLLYGLVCLVYIITRKESLNRKKLLDAERLETERLMRIVEIQRDIATQNTDLNTAMLTICERTQELVAAEGSIVEMVEEGDMVYRAASGTAAPHIGLRISAEGSLSGMAVRENRVLVCDDALVDERVDREACMRVGLRSMVVVPLRHEGVAIGVLKVLSSHACIFREHHVATLELMAATLSATVSDALATDALQAANELLRQANAGLAYQKSDLEEANIRLESLATTDGLTGLKNHRTFQEKLTEEFQRSNRHKSELSLVLLDVDHFKSFNDVFGHPAGDGVLKRVANLLMEAARTTDCVARYGGEEFALLLPETSMQGALKTAERIRHMIADAPWDQRTITVSIGISTVNPATESTAQLLKVADSALYQSKNLGRNRVTHAQAAGGN